VVEVVEVDLQEQLQEHLVDQVVVDLQQVVDQEVVTKVLELVDKEIQVVEVLMQPLQV
jgi:hypothetical protein|tara:strand:- start:191 stop:364 length:174 start_codon:yes stop_codon:yes gene_type:complete